MDTILFVKKLEDYHYAIVHEMKVDGSLFTRTQLLVLKERHGATQWVIIRTFKDGKKKIRTMTWGS